MEIEGAGYWQDRTEEDQRKDWKDDAPWIDGYWNSSEHPHRRLIIEELTKLQPFDSVFEVGCSCGPNLNVIGGNFIGVRLGGIDVSGSSIREGQRKLPDADLRVGNASSLPTESDSYDVVLADACLMYIGLEDIKAVISEMARVAKKAIIIVDWHNEESTQGVIEEFHWTRNYEKLLNEQGFVVEKKKLTKEDWPSKNWEKLGYIYVGTK